MPERIYRGETRVIEGTIFSEAGLGLLPGMRPILTLRKGLTKLEVEAVIIGQGTGKFIWNLPSSFTGALELGTWDYEISIVGPAEGEVYVVEQGQVDVVARI